MLHTHSYPIFGTFSVVVSCMLVLCVSMFEIYATSPTLYSRIWTGFPTCAVVADVGLKKCDVFDVIPCVTELA